MHLPICCPVSGVLSPDGLRLTSLHCCNVTLSYTSLHCWGILASSGRRVASVLLLVLSFLHYLTILGCPIPWGRFRGQGICKLWLIWWQGRTVAAANSLRIQLRSQLGACALEHTTQKTPPVHSPPQFLLLFLPMAVWFYHAAIYIPFKIVLFPFHTNSARFRRQLNWIPQRKW